MKKLIAVLCTAAVLFSSNLSFSSESIAEEPNNHPNLADTEIHGVLGLGNIGIGVRFGFPLVKQGFVDDLNNNVAINFGVDLVNWSAPDYGITGIVLPVMLQWNVYLTQDWAVFAEGGVAFEKWFAERANGEHQTSYFWPGIALGARYYFNPSSYPALVFRLGFPSGLSIGVSF